MKDILGYILGPIIDYVFSNPVAVERFLLTTFFVLSAAFLLITTAQIIGWTVYGCWKAYRSLREAIR